MLPIPRTCVPKAFYPCPTRSRSVIFFTRMSPFSPQDLTGNVRKIDKYYFANGGLADIWKAELSRGSSRRIVAVKVIRSAWSKGDHLETLKKKLLREAKIWSQLDHPNITPFYGICFDLGAPSAPCLVCPYFKNGNVADFLEKNPDTNRMKLVFQVASGLAYLHRCGIIHGDIKSSNILVSDGHEARIADFGLSRILETEGFTTKSVGGTCRWMAYELIAPQEEEEEETIPQLTMATDIWAFGMTALEIITGRLPFCHLKYDTAVMLSIMRGGRPKQETYPAIGRGIWFMLERCWHADPTQRPSMESLSRQALKYVKSTVFPGNSPNAKQARQPDLLNLSG